MVTFKNNKKASLIINSILGLIVLIWFVFTIPSMLFDMKYIVGWSITLLGISIYFIFYYFSRDIFHPVGVFSVVLISTFGISNFKLSLIQTEISNKTWVVVFGTYISFLVGYIIMKYLIKTKKTKWKVEKLTVNQDKFLSFIYWLFLICIIAFIAEVIESGFNLPIFSNSTGSYREFGIQFIHYLTVTLALVNYLITIYFFKYKKVNKLLMIIYAISLLSVLALLSRQLLIFLIILTIVSYNYMFKKIKLIHIGVLILLGLSAFTVLGNLRTNSSLYIFEVGKIVDGIDSPLIAWVYLYFAMSYENLNYYINNFNDLYYGVLSFFPVFAFTLTKGYVQPDLAQYLPSPHLTVSTMMYDFYLDFGIFGIIVFPLLIGAISYYSYYLLKKQKNVVSVIFFSMILHNLFFVFFVNFFSNTTWFFHMGVLLFFVIIVSNNSPISKWLEKARIKN